MTNLLKSHFPYSNRYEQLYIHISVQAHMQVVHDSFLISKVNEMAKYTNKQ